MAPRLPSQRFGQKEKERIAAEAHKRKDERAEAVLNILKEQAGETDKHRQYEEAHKDKERFTWAQQLAIAKLQLKAATSLNRITVTAAIIALFSVLALVMSIVDARKATIEANRGWIEIYGADASGNLNGDQGIPITVYYRNIGKGPVLKINQAFLGGSTDIIGKDSDSPIKVGVNHMCEGLNPDPDGVAVFPDPAIQMRFYTTMPSKDISAWVKTNDAALYLKGCVTYVTMTEIHQTWFCFQVYRNGKFATQTTTILCGDGHGAN